MKRSAAKRKDGWGFISGNLRLERGSKPKLRQPRRTDFIDHQNLIQRTRYLSMLGASLRLCRDRLRQREPSLHREVQKVRIKYLTSPCRTQPTCTFLLYQPSIELVMRAEGVNICKPRRIGEAHRRRDGRLSYGGAPLSNGSSSSIAGLLIRIHSLSFPFWAKSR